MTLEDAADRERSSIEADIESSDEEIRRLAVERLLVLPLENAVPHLVECLGDESWRVRKAAVGRLVACAESELAVDALISSLSDGDNPGRRNSAVEALVECGPAMIGRLVQALESDDVDVRKLLIDTMAGIGDERCRGAVIATLGDPDVNVRGASADALGVIGGDGALQALRERATCDDEDALVRLSALRSLSRLEAKVDPAELASVLDDPTLRPAGFALLGHSDHPLATDALLKGLAQRSCSSRDAAIAALLEVVSRRDGAESEALAERIRETARSIEGLLEATIEQLPEVGLSQRLVLVQFLGLVADESCVVPILEAGRDEAIAEVAHGILQALGGLTETALSAGWSQLESDLRSDACVLLGRTGGEQAGVLLASSLDDPDSELRARAARALGERGCVDALPDLVRRLESAAADEDFEAEEEQRALVGALVELANTAEDGDDVTSQAVALLSGRLDGAVESVRLAIASVLGQIGRVEDAELVTSLLKDPSAPVRRCAVEALARLEPGAASEPLRLALADESPVVRMAAATALGHSDRPEVIDDLVRLAHDEDERVRAATLRAVGGHCEEHPSAETRARAMALIRGLLDNECLVALAGVEALAKLGGNEVAEAVSTLLGRPEPEVLRAAIDCIGEHGDADAVAELLALVPHPDWSVRVEAIQILAERGVAQAVPPILRCLETEQDSFVRETILRALKRLEE